jgi:hypothetical protein
MADFCFFFIIIFFWSLESRSSQIARYRPGGMLYALKTENGAVTGPVARFARMIAGHGYICAAPSSYHEFTGPEPLKYEAEDTDKGNLWKVQKVRADWPSPCLCTFKSMRSPNLDLEFLAC